MMLMWMVFIQQHHYNLFSLCVCVCVSVLCWMGMKTASSSFSGVPSSKTWCSLCVYVCACVVENSTPSRSCHALTIQVLLVCAFWFPKSFSHHTHHDVVGS
jgi:hypothetical protein